MKGHFLASRSKGRACYRVLPSLFPIHEALAAFFFFFFFFFCFLGKKVCERERKKEMRREPSKEKRRDGWV